MFMPGLEQMLGISLSYMMIKVIYLKVCDLYDSPFQNHVHIMQCHGLDQLMPPHWGLDIYMHRVTQKEKKYGVDNVSVMCNIYKSI